MVDSTHSEPNKNSFTETQFQDHGTHQNDDRRPFKVQRMWGHYFIVLDDELHPHEDQWYSQELRPSGDILLKRRVES